MILHTFTTDIRDPLQRGRQIGETFSEQIRQTVALYLDFFPRVGVEIDKHGPSARAACPRWPTGARRWRRKWRAWPWAPACRCGSWQR